MGKRKYTGVSSSSSKQRPSRPATTSPAHPPPTRRSGRRSTFGEPSGAMPLAFCEPPLLLTAASATNFGILPIALVPRVSPPPSPPVSPPSPFTYSPPSPPLPHPPAAQSSPPPFEPPSPPQSPPAPASPPPPPSSSVNKGKAPASTPPPPRRSRRRATHSASPSATSTSPSATSTTAAVPSLPLPLSVSSKIVDPQSDPRRVPRVDDLPCRPSSSSASVKSRCQAASPTTTAVLSYLISHLSAEYEAVVARADELKKKLDYFTALAQKGGDSSGGVDNEASHQEEPHTWGADAAAGPADPAGEPTVPTVPTVDGTTTDVDTDDDGELFADAEDTLD